MISNWQLPWQQRHCLLLLAFDDVRRLPPLPGPSVNYSKLIDDSRTQHRPGYRDQIALDQQQQ